jgi:FixJ family two-component response regulator
MAQPELSQRELQVLKQMALGKSNKEIGQVLYIGEHTVVKLIPKHTHAGDGFLQSGTGTRQAAMIVKDSAEGSMEVIGGHRFLRPS